MAVGGKFDEMMAYPGELVKAVKSAREESSRRDAEEKSKKYIEQAKERLASKQNTAKQEEKSPSKGTDISIGSTVEKIKARNKMMSEL